MPLAPQCLCLFIAGCLAVVEGVRLRGDPGPVPVELLAIEAPDSRLDLAIDDAVRELYPVKLAPPRAQVASPPAAGGPWLERGQGARPAGMRWHYGTHHKSGTALLGGLMVEHVMVMQMGMGSCFVRAGIRPPEPPGCVQRRDNISVWLWSHLTERLIGDIANNRIDWSDVYHRNHTDWRDPGHLAVMPPTQIGKRKPFREAPSKLRGVMIIRDPLSMVLSTYVFHLKSDEVPALNKIRNMSMEDGVALVIRYTLDRGAREMLDAYRSLPKWIMPVRFEGFTSSSESFDESAAAVYEYMLGDIYTEEERTRLLESAKLHDLRRNPPAVGEEHVSDSDLKQKVRSVLRSIPKEYIDPLLSWRALLGY